MKHICQSFFIVTLIITISLMGAGCAKDAQATSQNEKTHAVSSATPIALTQTIPAGLNLKVTGGVKKEYNLNSKALGQMATTRIRTRETSPAGHMMGAYIYTGIPVLYLLEGIAPLKTDKDAYDRPLDMFVILRSASGKEAVFSYGELTMTDDQNPVTLAFHREPLMPTKGADKYTKNKYKTNINGLHLICPREPNTARYLDNVTEIILKTPKVTGVTLPPQQKGNKCKSQTITCVQSGESTPAIYKEVERITIENWFRIGHGRGIKDDRLNKVEGYALPSFLRKNFPGCTENDFFLFVACDGYRSLFSGKEIFATHDGSQMLLVETLNDAPPSGGKTLAPTADFFVDRNLWGLSHIVKL